MLTLDLLLDNPNHVIKDKIETVVLYPRKSRPSAKLATEEDLKNDLEIQIERLTKYAISQNWKYILKVEIESGENLEHRPVINEIFKELNEGKYDAVLVTSYDRLSRGSASDHEKILLSLRKSNAVIIEDSGALYNPFNEQDLQLLQMKGNFSNYEYKSIVGRFTESKRSASRMGRWVSGSAPYGYVFNRKSRKLTIHEEQSIVYRDYMLKPYLDGKSVGDISWELNKLKIPSPRNGMWSNTTVINMLKSEIYCGTMIYNKTQGNKQKKDSLNRNPYRQLERDKWIVVHNTHPILKTQEEHEQVMELFKLKGKAKGIAKEYHPLSGMIKCHHCGQSLRIQRSDKTNNSYVKKCVCGQTRGGEIILVTETIVKCIELLKDKIVNMKQDDSLPDEKQHLLNEVSKLEEKITKEEQAIERIRYAFDEGEYTLNEMQERKEIRLLNIYDLEGNIRRLKDRLKSIVSLPNEEIYRKIDKTLDDIRSSNSNDELSNAYKSLIREVIWRRDEDKEVEVTVNFL